MNKQLVDQGMRYGENLFLNNQNHLQIDKNVIKDQFDLNGKKILDFGCGTGGLALWLASQWNCQLTGMDIDKNHIYIANQLKQKHNIKVKFECRNILENPPTDQFDLIFLTDVIEHISSSAIVPILVQLKSNIIPGGKIYVSYPPWEGPYASHVAQLLKIPWCQYLPQNFLLNQIRKNDRQLEGLEVSNYMEAYLSLNKMNHHRLCKFLKQAELKITYRKSHLIFNRLRMLENFNFNVGPLKYLVTKEFLILA